MSRQAIAPGAWRLLLTTTRDTLVGIEGGSVRLMTGATTNIPFHDGTLLMAGDSLVVPTGLQVSLYTDQNGVAVTDIAFGV